MTLTVISVALTAISVVGGLALRVYAQWSKTQTERTRELSAREWMNLLVNSVEEEVASNPELVRHGEAKLKEVMARFQAKYPEIPLSEVYDLARGSLPPNALGATAKAGKGAE